MKWIPIYIVYISIFAMASLEKFTGGIPQWFIKQFEPTFIAQLPGGLGLSFYSIAALEAFTAILFIISLLRGEFLPEKSTSFLRAALTSACFVFAELGFGLRLTHDFNGAFQVFCYAVLSFGLLAYSESVRTVSITKS